MHVWSGPVEYMNEILDETLWFPFLKYFNVLLYKINMRLKKVFSVYYKQIRKHLQIISLYYVKLFSSKMYHCGFLCCRSTRCHKIYNTVLYRSLAKWQLQTTQVFWMLHYRIVVFHCCSNLLNESRTTFNCIIYSAPDSPVCWLGAQL